MEPQERGMTLFGRPRRAAAARLRAVSAARAAAGVACRGVCAAMKPAGRTCAAASVGCGAAGAGVASSAGANPLAGVAVAAAACDRSPPCTPSAAAQLAVAAATASGPAMQLLAPLCADTRWYRAAGMWKPSGETLVAIGCGGCRNTPACQASALGRGAGVSGDRRKALPMPRHAAARRASLASRPLRRMGGVGLSAAAAVPPMPPQRPPLPMASGEKARSATPGCIATGVAAASAARAKMLTAAGRASACHAGLAPEASARAWRIAAG